MNNSKLLKFEEIKKFLKNPQTIKTVVRELEKTTGKKFNTNGILAGQAVASKIYELLNLNINPVINDVDLFFFMSPYQYEQDKNKINSTASLTIGFKETYDPYSHVSFFIQKRFFSILGTARRGLTNYIFVSFNNWELGYPSDSVYETPFSKDFSRTVKFKLLINSFDINAVQIGIDLKTKQIYFTDEFVNFLITKQMQLSTYMTPVHSIIRLERKAKELGVYTDVEDEILGLWSMQQILKTAYRYYEPQFDEKNYNKVEFFTNLFQGTPVFFGKKHLEQINGDYLKEMTNPFSISQVLKTDTDIPLFTLFLNQKGISVVEKEIEMLNSLYSKTESMHGVYKDMLNIANMVLEDEKKVIYSLKRFYGVEKQQTVGQSLKKCVTGIPETEKVELVGNFFQYVKSYMPKLTMAYKKAKYSKKNKTYFFIEKAKKTKPANADKMYNVPYLVGPITGNIHIEEAYAFLYENIKFSEHNPQLVYQMTKTIHKEFKNQPHYVYGAFLYCFAGETLNNAVKLFNAFFSYSKTARLMIVGKAEQKMQELRGWGCFLYSEFKSYMLLDENKRKKVEQLLKADASRPLKRTKFMFKNEHIEIVELITKKELIEEGIVMNHCVAGYADSIEKNKSIVLKVIDKKRNIRATIELVPLVERTMYGDKIKQLIFEKKGKFYRKNYVVFQFKGKANKKDWLFKDIKHILEIVNQKFKILPLTDYDFEDIVKTDDAFFKSNGYELTKKITV